jgi:hypothetical protein
MGGMKCFARSGCVVAVALVWFASQGCSSGEGSAEGPAAAARAAQSFQDDCTGDVECTDASGPVRSTRQRRGERCIVGGLVLEGGGVVEGNPAARWTGDARSFAICVGTQCLTCTSVASGAAGAAEEAEEHEAACKGSPSSCSSGSPGSCAEVRGCRMASHLRYDGSFENLWRRRRVCRWQMRQSPHRSGWGELSRQAVRTGVGVSEHQQARRSGHDQGLHEGRWARRGLRALFGAQAVVRQLVRVQPHGALRASRDPEVQLSHFSGGVVRT